MKPANEVMEEWLDACEGEFDATTQVIHNRDLERLAALIARERQEAVRELVEKALIGAPDCGDNSCRFGGKGKGGMRTNGGCRCLADRPNNPIRIYFERLYWYVSELAKEEGHE